MKTIVVTGAAGFIGSALVRELLKDPGVKVLALDKLTYAGNLQSLRGLDEDGRFVFVEADIGDSSTIRRIFDEQNPLGVIHLAAESHVDRSIDGADDFVETNVVGTFRLLEAVRGYWENLSSEEQGRFRFHHVSTDEVYGDLKDSGDLFTEETPYHPSSPYSASKAASDHFVRAWGRTYGLPFVMSNSSNNYGPRQFPEKLIPFMILNALSGKALPVYGDGSQVRDWLYVEDHASALATIFFEGKTGETYNVGGGNELKNIEVVERTCSLLEIHAADRKPDGVSAFRELITFVEDRPGHDVRYAIDASKLQGELGWKPAETFETGMEKTIRWYLENEAWWQNILSGDYRLERLGGA